MLKRALLLSLSLWLMITGGLGAHASPCHMQDEMTPAAISAPAADAHDHCDMMADAGPAPTPAETPEQAPASDTACCCPAVLAALPAPAISDAAAAHFTLPASFPPGDSGPSRTLIPEPPPPKA